MRKVKEVLSDNLRIIRKSRGLTQDQLALLVGCSKNHISAIERGLKFPRMGMIEKFATAMQIKPFILFVDLRELEPIQNSSQIDED